VLDSTALDPVDGAGTSGARRAAHRPSGGTRTSRRARTATAAPSRARDVAPAADSIRVLIADPEPAFRAGVRAALEADGFTVVAESSNASAAVAKAVETQPDICLLDIEMPGNGLNAVSAIARQSPRTTIVVLTHSSDSADLLASLERGASGYLLKGIGTDDLAKSLRATRLGEPALSRAMVPALIRQVRGRPQRRISMPDGPVELTVREWDVAELLRDGLNTVEIGNRLGVSPITVRRHAASLMHKVGAGDRKAVIRVLKMFAR
jgi:two-component system, NarL family, nitrate/nitrite response regulator NarL